MKYIRLEDGIYETYDFFVESFKAIKDIDCDFETLEFEEINDGRTLVGKVSPFGLDKKYSIAFDIVKQSNTIEELLDVPVCEKEVIKGVVEERTKDGKIKKAKTKFEVAIILARKYKYKVYGAIWVEGKHNEPILKSVAKMKGILPNGKIDWKLL